jgi:hypothetical protein
LYSRPSAPRIVISAATALATLAAIAIASPGHAQTAPGTDSPPGVAVPPPTGEPPAARAPGPAQPGQAAPGGPAAAAPAPSEQTGAPPRHSAARHRSSGPVKVTARVNLRRQPNTDAEVVTVIPAGSGVRVGECEGDWCQVTWNGHSGWAVAWNLDLGDPRVAGGYPGQPGLGYPGRDHPAYGPGHPYFPPPARHDLDDFGSYYHQPRYFVPTPWGWKRYYGGPYYGD